MIGRTERASRNKIRTLVTCLVSIRFMSLPPEGPTRKGVLRPIMYCRATPSERASALDFIPNRES